MQRVRMLWPCLLLWAYVRTAGAQTLYECALGCSDDSPVSTSSTGGIAGGSAVGVSPAAVALAVSALQSAGVMVTGSYQNQLSLLLTPQQLGSAAVQQHCCYTVLSRPRTSRLETWQAWKAMLGEKLLQVQPNLGLLNGTGVRIGIISDSYWLLPGAAAQKLSPCAAVNTANILRDLAPNEVDGVAGYGEGRAMAELICFIAPGAEFIFHTGFLGEANMSAAIRQLADVGCDIIVDDIYYTAEAEYSPGILTQAVEVVHSQGVAYFGAAGNMAGTAWEANADWFTLGNRTWHNFGSANKTTAFLKVILYWDLSGWSMDLQLQWNEPFYRYTNGRAGALSDVDMFWCPTQEISNRCHTENIDNNGEGTSPGSDAAEWVAVPIKQFENTYYLAIELVDTKVTAQRSTAATDSATTPAALPTAAGADQIGSKLAPARQQGLSDGDPAQAGQHDGQHTLQQELQQELPDLRLKLRWYGTDTSVRIPGGQNGNTNNGPTIIPHVNTPGAMAIGAARYDMTPGYGARRAIAERFSSPGQTPIFYDATGQKLPTPLLYQKPDVVGPDSTDTSSFPPKMLDPNADWDRTGFPNFVGTSAAAPNVAALAALLLQQNPLLQPDDMYGRLRGSALDMLQPGYDPKTGFGFVSVVQLLTGCVGASDGSACSDGNLCTANDVCMDGICIGAPVVCNATSCSTVGICDPATGQCTVTPKPDGLPCPSPSSALKLSSTCYKSNWQCISGSCAEVRTPTRAGLKCTDSDPCTKGDRCDGRGMCVGRRVCGVP